MMSMAIIQEVLYWPAAALAVMSAVGFAIDPDRKAVRMLMWVAFGLLSAHIVARWIVTGHPPVFGSFENSVAGTWSLLAGTLVLSHPRFAWMVPKRVVRFSLLWVIPMLALGLFFSRTPYPLTISERSLLVDVHVLFAWIAHTVLLVTATAGIVVVTGHAGSDEQAIDDVLYRGVGIGFAFFTLMLAVGSVYSYLLFSKWYQWEIVETLAAAVWLAYGAVLHAASMFQWRSKKLAWAVLCVLPLLIAVFWVWSFYTQTYHHFDLMELKAF